MAGIINRNKTIRRFTLNLDREADRDLIARLEQQDPYQEYLKRLIREDLNRKKAPPAKTASKAEADFNATLEVLRNVAASTK